MRVAFILSSFPKISETFILNQITGLIDRGVEVDIYAWRNPNEESVHPDVEKYSLLDRTYYMSAPPGKFSRLINAIGLIRSNLRQLKPILRSLDVFRFQKKAISLVILHQIAPFLSKGPYDIVHCHYGLNGKAALFLKDMGVLQGRVVTTFHGYDISSYVYRMGREIYSELFTRGDLFLCVSEYMKKRLIELGCSEEKVCVHKSGIDLDKFTLNIQDKVNKRVCLVTIGRLVEKKGVQYGIRAVAKLVKKYPDIEYLIVGEGPLRGELESLIDSLEVGKQVKLLGWKKQNEIVKLLKRTDMLLAPSVTTKDGDQEGIPVVIMEALAQGVPVISTWHSGIPEVVQDGKSGFLVPERDVDGLVDKIESLINNAELRISMGLNGRQFIEKHHNLNMLNNELLSIYKRLLESN